LSAAVYLDTSVVVAYYVPEPLSARAQARITSEAQPAVSDLVELELLSALSLRLRSGDLEREHVERVTGVFLSHLEAGLYTRLHVDVQDFLLARRFIGRFDLPIESPDALHLAFATNRDLELVTADQQLGRNARRLGLAVDLIQMTD
jgi:uncharacterized protein